MNEKPMTPVPAPFSDSEGMGLRSFVATLLDSWKALLATVGVCVAIGFYSAATARPQFTALSLVEIETKSSGYVMPVGENAQAASQLLMGSSESIMNQIEIIKSRTLLSEAIEEADLDLQVTPSYWSALGEAWAFRRDRDKLAGVPFFLPQLEKYAWGGERIAVKEFKIPDVYRSGRFTLVAGDEGLYKLKVGDNVVLEGKVGQASTGNLANGPISIYLSELRARKGTEFTITRLPIPKAAEALRSEMSLRERGATGYMAGSGVLELKITDDDADFATRAANAIATVYLRWNVRNLSEEANKKLEFLNEQLPRLQADVNVSEEKLLLHKTQEGNLRLSPTTTPLLDDLVAVDKTLSELEIERAELSQTYTPQHPMMESLGKKRELLMAGRAKIMTKLSALPASEQKLLQLTRDSQVANLLYMDMLNRAQEIKLVRAGTVGNVRIVDTALRPDVPSGPNRMGILARWLFGGLVLGMLLAFTRKQISITSNTPDELELKLGVPVYATVPHSDSEDAFTLKRKTKSKKVLDGGALLTRSDPTDPAIESLRSLRASLHFALMESQSNLVMISGPAPSVGKSFVAANLAAVIASAGQRVLLIDGDLRRGHLHESLGFDRSPGLSEYLSEQAELKDAARQVSENFYAMTTGRLPPNPAELLASRRFHELLQAARKDYDVVVADSPPVMNLADAVLIARSAGAVFVVVRGGRSSLGEVRDAIKRFLSNNIKVDGLVFNDFTPRLSGYLRGSYGNYYYYRKYRRYV